MTKKEYFGVCNMHEAGRPSWNEKYMPAHIRVCCYAISLRTRIQNNLETEGPQGRDGTNVE
jgi:hypothetical protein